MHTLKMTGKPDTQVVGSVRKAIRDPKTGIVAGHDWVPARPYGHALHFVSRSAKLRALARIMAEGKTEADLNKAGLPLTAYALERDLKKVPVYKGLPSDVFNKQGRVWPRSKPSQEAKLAA